MRYPGTSNSGQEEGREPLSAGATKGESLNTDISQRDSALARPMGRQGGSTETENPTSLSSWPLIRLWAPPLTKPNRKLEGKKPDDVICRVQTVRAQKRHGGELIHRRNSK